MIPSSLIPTPLLTAQDIKPIRLVEPGAERFRVLRIIYGLVRWMLGLFWLSVRGRLNGESAGQLTGSVLQRLGFLWIKIGQLIALRADILPQEFCDELANLHYRADGFPAEVARKAIEDELGRPVEEVFDQFEDLPMAAASIAQVHRARLRANGVPVVVKIMRPGARRIFTKDVAFVSKLIWVVERFKFAAAFNLGEALWELEQIAKEEVDFRYELHNIVRFRKNVRQHKVYVPKPFPSCSSRRVLVMERVEGVLMSDYIRIQREAPERVRAWAEENGIQPRLVAQRLFLSFLRQMFEDNLFHGDLHPGNVFLLRCNHVALIDLGSLGSGEEDLMQRYLMGLRAISEKRYRQAVAMLLSMSPSLPMANFARIEEEMVRVLRAWEGRIGVPGIPYYERLFSNLYVQLSKVMMRHRIATSWALLRIDRSLVTLEYTLGELSTKLTYPALLRRYLEERWERTLRHPVKVLTSALVDGYHLLQEYRLFAEPLLQRVSRMIEPVLTTGEAILRFVFRSITVVMVLVGGFLLFTYLHQHKHLSYPDALEHIVRRVPLLEVWHWVLLGVGVLMLLLFFWRLAWLSGSPSYAVGGRQPRRGPVRSVAVGGARNG